MTGAPVVLRWPGARATVLQANVGLHVADEGSPVPELWLMARLGFDNGEQMDVALALDPLDPYELASSLQGCADEVVHAVARFKGWSAQAEQQALREKRREAKLNRQAARRMMEEQVAVASSCAYCQRPVAFVFRNEDDEQVRVCKRHAEELGVRPHGKVGEPEPGELPGDTKEET